MDYFKYPKISLSQFSSNTVSTLTGEWSIYHTIHSCVSSAVKFHQLYCVWNNIQVAYRASQTICTPLVACISSPTTSRHISYAPVMRNYLHSPNFPYSSMPEELVQVFPPLRRLLPSSQILSTSTSFQKRYFGHFSYITLVSCCAAKNRLIIVFLLTSYLFFLFILFYFVFIQLPVFPPMGNQVLTPCLNKASRLLRCC